MTGTIVTRTQHACVGGKRRWVQRPATGEPPPCKRCGAETGKGDKRYDCVWRASGKQRWKTFNTRKEAEKFLTSVVKTVQDGTYTHTRPMLMDKVFDSWLLHAQLQETQGRIKPSTMLSYTSMLKKHLRPAFAEVRSDRAVSTRLRQPDAEFTVATAARRSSPSPSHHSRRLVALGSHQAAGRAA